MDRWRPHGLPYTPSVSDVNRVEAACDEILEQDSTSRSSFNRAARATRAGVKAMGLELWPRSEEIAASCITAVTTPEGVDTLGLLAHIREH